MVPVFTFGAVRLRIPDNKAWHKALQLDPETKQLLDIVKNPGLSDNKSILGTVHSIYRQPARNGHLSEKNGILYMKEIFSGDTKFVNLQIVPVSMRNIIFIAFHANPIGRHLDSF